MTGPAARWNPADYAANAAAQTAWGSALHARLALAGDETVFDLGCGDAERRAAFIDAVIARFRREHPVDAEGRTRVAAVRLEVEAVAV